MSVARRGIMPKQEVVGIVDREYEIRVLKNSYNLSFGLPNKNYNLGQFYDLMEVRLDNQNQKNAVSAFMNSISNSEAGSVTLKAITLFAQFIKGDVDTRTLMSGLSSLSRESIKQKSYERHPNLDIVVECSEEEMESLNMGAKKEPVKILSFDEIAVKAMNEVKVLDDPNHEINIDKLNLNKEDRDKFRESKYNVETIRILIEGKLKNQEQKDVVRSVLNGCSKTGFKDDSFLGKFIANSNALIKGVKTASGFMDALCEDLRIADHFDRKGEYVSDANKLATKDRDIRILGKASKANVFDSSADSKKSEFPAVNVESSKFFHTITTNAKLAKGRVRDSEQYILFYHELKKATELMDKLNILDMHEDAIIPLKDFKNKDLKKELRPNVKNGGYLNRDDLMAAYEKTRIIKSNA